MTGRFTDKVKDVLARQIRDEEKVAGTIAKVAEGRCLIIVFTDGKWVHYEEHYGVHFASGCPLPDMLGAAGLLTEAECEEQWEKEHAFLAEKTRRRELADLKYLQEKHLSEAQKAEAKNADA